MSDPRILTAILYPQTLQPAAAQAHVVPVRAPRRLRAIRLAALLPRASRVRGDMTSHPCHA